MTRLIELNDALFCRYVQTLNLRPTTGRQYTGALRRFQRFRATQLSPESLSEAVLIDWVKAMSVEVPLDKLYDMARKLDGFFSWLVEQGQLSANPWTPLREPYGQRLAPIIRAKCSP